MADFAAARRMMVDGQIRTNDVTDQRLLSAFQEIPREVFVPRGKRDLAYLDRDIAVNEGQGGKPARCMLKPMTLAKLIQALALSETDRVLDVGCATGYSSAILARLAASVVALEIDQAVAVQAKAALQDVGARNVEVVTGPLTAGMPAKGPYDAIMLEGSAEMVPDALFGQLAEGGRLVAIIGAGPASKAMIYSRNRGDISGRPIFDASAAPLPNFTRAPAFVF
jgi:protein-L-isoaspartate(D-aspartate) O-methyltransferase